MARQVTDLLVDMYGIKCESPSQRIALEQSQADRTKKKFDPATISVNSNEVTKMTVSDALLP
jgi:hypothetical protein